VPARRFSRGCPEPAARRDLDPGARR